MFKNEKRTNCEKPETRLYYDQCFNTKDLKFQYFWLTTLTIPIANDNRPMADCEKTSRLIGFPRCFADDRLTSSRDINPLSGITSLLTWKKSPGIRQDKNISVAQRGVLRICGFPK